jgi:DNA-binding transcriptional ArsR family regulator
MDKITKSAELFKALSDPTRLKIVKLLNESNGALCVNAVTGMLDVSQSAVSQHLRVLRQIGLVDGARYGFHVHYSLNKDTLKNYMQIVHQALGEDFVI